MKREAVESDSEEAMSSRAVGLPRLSLDSPWSPLRDRLFRALWIAAVVSNVGTWLQNVGGVWLMTALTPSPLMAALMQAATSLPFFLIGLPAGAAADIFDRRRLLLVTHAWMALAAMFLAVLTVFGAATPSTLLFLTFVLGIGSAVTAPAWQAVIPEIAGRHQLQKAIALNGVSYNIARVLGPAIGGVIISTLGTAADFFLNALSFLGVMHVLFRWQRTKAESTLPTERFVGAIRAGIRYLRHAPELQAVLVRTGLFTVFASALWALLPVAMRQRGEGSAGYGLLLGCLGAGSLAGAAMLPKIAKFMSLDARLASAAGLYAIGTASLALPTTLVLLCPMMFIAGLGWLMTMVSVSVSTQTVAPDWVKARALAFYVLVSQGGLAFGSFLWGALASEVGLSTTLFVAAAGLIGGLAAIHRWPLARVREIDTTSAGQWPDPQHLQTVDPDDGPVLVTIEYLIAPGQSDSFKEAMRFLEFVRRRDGAIRWELYHDIERPGRFIESFVVESWAEHMRQHARLTRADATLKAAVNAFHREQEPPKVSHLLYDKT